MRILTKTRFLTILIEKAGSNENWITNAEKRKKKQSNNLSLPSQIN